MPSAGLEHGVCGSPLLRLRLFPLAARLASERGEGFGRSSHLAIYKHGLTERMRCHQLLAVAPLRPPARAWLLLSAASPPPPVAASDGNRGGGAAEPKAAGWPGGGRRAAGGRALRMAAHAPIKENSTPERGALQFREF
eukprot:COSAG01_NODE_2654_length_7306_cov_60.980991_7_plen_139_part_00